jgi:hypothetical protein
MFVITSNPQIAYTLNISSIFCRIISWNLNNINVLPMALLLIRTDNILPPSALAFSFRLQIQPSDSTRPRGNPKVVWFMKRRLTIMHGKQRDPDCHP